MAFNPNIPGYSTQGKSFSRTAAFPLESYEIWTDLEALKAYAANTDASKDPSYIGQKVAYIDTKNNRVVHYGIEIDGTLKELGADKMGVEALGKEDEGKIPKAFYVIDSEASGEESAEDYQPEVGHVEIRWVTPEAFEDTNTVTTVEAADKSVEVTNTAEEDFEGYKYQVKVKLADLGPNRENALRLFERIDEQGVDRSGLYVELPDTDEYTVSRVDGMPGEGIAGHYHLDKNGKHVTGSDFKIPDFVTMSVDEDGDEEHGEHGSIKCYTFKQGDKLIGHIDIPTDLVVQSGSVVVATEEDKALDEAVIVGETYIKLVIAHQEKPLYIPTTGLVDLYDFEDTNTIDFWVDDTNTVRAFVKISGDEGNTLEDRKDGLYVNVPEMPDANATGDAGVTLTGTYDSENKEYLITATTNISKEPDNSIQLKEDGFYTPDITIPDVEEVTEVDTAVPVIADIVVNKDNKHQLDLSLVYVAPVKDGRVPEALLPELVIADSVDKPLPEKQEDRPVTDKVITALTAKDHTITPTALEVVTKAGWDKIVGENGVRVLNQEEINKLSALNIESDGSVAISGTINASNVHGLGSEVIDIVTGTGDYVSTPGVGNEGEEGYIAPTIVAKLGVEKGAQVNKIESIALPDRILPILEKEVTIPYATLDGTTYYSGVVRSKEAVNHIVYNEGYGEVYSLSTDKLVNGANELILNGGNAAGTTN